MEKEMKDNCVFCDQTKFSDSLIGENDDWYIVATLGQIVTGYTLIIPKKHISCLGALDSRHQIKSITKLSREVSRALTLEYPLQPVTMFEHGIVGQTIKHAHLHLLPTTVDCMTLQIRMDFPQAEIEEIQSFAQLRKLYRQRQEPYLLWTIPNGKMMVCWNPPAPPMYLRLITAKLIGRPERGSWRDMDPALDKYLRESTVARLKPYFS